MFLDSATQRISLVGFDGSSITQDYAVINVDTSVIQTIKTTGVLGVSTDSVIEMLFSVEFIR